MKVRLITEEAAVEMLRNAIDREYGGNQQRFCRRYGIDTGYVSRILHGKQKLGKSILDVIGLESVLIQRCDKTTR